MYADRPSRTAMSAAVARGTHRLWDDPPWIFVDPYALLLVGEGWEELAAASRAMVPETAWRQGHAGVLVRSRYPEDRLEPGNFEQYVVLGAGLDSFAWRRPDLMRVVHLFEVDHPATQAWKQKRAENLGLPRLAQRHFVPIDFQIQPLANCLSSAGFDWRRRSLFSWVGTTMYLDAASVADTLRVVARCAAGSEIVFSYNQDWEYVDGVGREFLTAVLPTSAEIGEPVLTSFAPAEIEELIDRCGLEVAEHPTADELAARYCRGRTDGLRPYTLERLIAARVRGN